MINSLSDNHTNDLIKKAVIGLKYQTHIQKVEGTAWFFGFYAIACYTTKDIQVVILR